MAASECHVSSFPSFFHYSFAPSGPAYRTVNTSANGRVGRYIPRYLSTIGSQVAPRNSGLRDKLETFWTVEHATSIGTMQPSLPETYRRVLEVLQPQSCCAHRTATLDVVEYSMLIGLQLKQSKALLRQRWISRYPFAPVPSFCQHWPSGESTSSTRID